MDDAPRWVYADKQLPEIHGAMAAVSREIKTRADRLGIDRTILELVNLRCSQITTFADRHLADDDYDLLREVVTDDQLALLIYAASMINAFNRVSILSHHPVTYRDRRRHPRARRSAAGRGVALPLGRLADPRTPSAPVGGRRRERPPALAASRSSYAAALSPRASGAGGVTGPRPSRAHR